MQNNLGQIDIEAMASRIAEKLKPQISTLKAATEKMEVVGTAVKVIGGLGGLYLLFRQWKKDRKIKS